MTPTAVPGAEPDDAAGPAAEPGPEPEPAPDPHRGTDAHTGPDTDLDGDTDSGGVAVVYATFPDREVAQRLVRDVLEARLAACATFWEAGSLYWWEGTVEQADECLALLKTAPDRVEALTRALAEAHPYDVPCILPLAVRGPLAAYAGWVGAEVSPAPP